MRPLRLGRVRRALIVAPHPDDEVIGAFGLIRRLRRRGAEVRVMVVTDGTASHPGSRRWPPPRLRAEREAESRRVLLGLGVPAGAVTFLRLPDSGLDAIGAAERQRVAEAIRRAGADLLVLPAAIDHHSDHQAVARLATGVRCPARRLAYLVWPERGGPPLARPRLLPLDCPTLVKRAAIARHRSQCGMIRDDPDGFRIDRAQKAAFARPTEIFGEGR